MNLLEFLFFLKNEYGIFKILTINFYIFNLLFLYLGVSLNRQSGKNKIEWSVLIKDRKSDLLLNLIVKKDKYWFRNLNILLESK